MGITERKAREKEQRREAIIDVAEKYFCERDYTSTTMNQIAEEVELNKATLYLYFKNKNDLFHAIVYRVLLLLHADFVSAVESQESGLERISALLDSFRDFTRKHPEYCTILHHRDENRDRAADASKMTPYDILTDEMGAKIIGIIKDCINRGVADGSVRQDVEPQRLAAILWSHAYGVMANNHDNEDFMENVLGVSVEEVIDSSFAIITDYLRSKN